MLEKRSNEFMLDLLKRAQPMQIEALRKGYGAHIVQGARWGLVGHLLIG